MDPVNIPWNRLFLFWEAYNKEFINLLNKWHDDAAQIRRPPPSGSLVSSENVLYDSFLDTWGAGNFEDPNVPLDKKSYFSALAVASLEPRAQCFEVLKDILETTQPDPEKPPLIKDPPRLKVSLEEANAKAQGALDQLERRFSNDLDALHDRVDPTLRDAIGESRDTYLKALIRMMDIETECFKVQRDFLKTGKVMAPSRA